jgi:hypothetical protein
VRTPLQQVVHQRGRPLGIVHGDREPGPVAQVEHQPRPGAQDQAVAARPDSVSPAAVVQGGYVLARAAGDPAPFDRAVRGVAALLEGVRR